MAKRIISLLLVLLMLGSVLVACGGDDTPDTPEPDNTGDAVSTDSEATETESETESETVTTEPDTTETEGNQPEESENAGSETEGNQPATSETAGNETEGNQPEESENAGNETEGNQPEGNQPEASEPEASQPEASEPEASEPEASEPEASQPEASEPADSEEPEETQTTTLGDGYVDADILKKLPQADYNGKVFNIALPNSGEHGYQFDADRLTGNLEIDAIYNWKKKIRTTFNVGINYKDEWGGEDAYASAAGAEIATGSSIYHIYGHYAYRMHEFVIQGYFQDWEALGQQTDANGTPYLNLREMRWDQKLNSEVTYNGKLLTLTGDLGVSKLQSAMATFVNVTLLEDYCGISLDDLYDIVEAGEWDFEEFKYLVSLIYEDDSVPGTSFGDTLGYLSTSGNSFDIWFPAFDIEITERDEINNTIRPTLMDDYNLYIIDELQKFYHDSENVMVGWGKTGAVVESDKFRNEELGFCTTRFSQVYGVNGFNNMSAFGIVPTPMWEETQGYYRTKLNDRYTVWGVAVCLNPADEQFTAHITDALCAESSETLYYQYYEVLLKNRYSKEPRTAQMVDLVMENPFFDTSVQFGTYLSAGDQYGYPYLPRYFVADRGLPIQSTYDAVEAVLEQRLQEIYACYQ